MTCLADYTWQAKYTPEDGDLVERFYLPALACAVRYDRTTGYFSATALALAMRGLAGLVRRGGRMRLIVGCTLAEAEVEAIQHGTRLRDTVEAHLLAIPLLPDDEDAAQALALLAWMIAQGCLDVKVAVPCDTQRRPCSGDAIFHEKSGIIEDQHGNRLAFAGSINETVYGWKHNWESFHVFTTWGGTVSHVDAEDASFGKLWAGQSHTALVLDVPQAVRQRLLQFLPADQTLPRQLQDIPLQQSPTAAPPAHGQAGPQFDARRVVWSFIDRAPALPHGGERIGEATSAVIPWPHQVRAFQRLYESWPPKLLIADEVGFGKTIQAGLLLRQAWLAGRARRILILTPKAVLKQWQVELREKFNLNWPIYDEQSLHWYASPGWPGEAVQPVSRQAWHTQPVVLASSQLMRRRDRAVELLHEAEPWDLIILDEAHHARRRGGGVGSADDRPNELLRLMQRLTERTQGLVLLTATPMQVSPVEVWDLLHVLGLPAAWHVQAFVDFFAAAAKPAPTSEDLAYMAALFRATEQTYGPIAVEDIQRFVPNRSRLKARKIVQALRDTATITIPLRQLETAERQAAVRIMKAHTPIRSLISRHSRELLRHYQRTGQLTLRIAARQVQDRFVVLTAQERAVYEAVEAYVSETYHNAVAEQKTAVGFVMTVYRRRLASSFAALAQTLERRLAGLSTQDTEDIHDDEIADEAMDADEATTLAQEALRLEERRALARLLAMVRQLPVDTKAQTLQDVLHELRQAGYQQMMIFTQYTDTMDFLRQALRQDIGVTVMCFSGRGGEVLGADGRWQAVSREAVKRRFLAGQADIMLCTDAAAEGLNFQFCGALINYDMPWNPMRVEQRIGRIDRLGQAHETIQIANLHYDDTVETDVYVALRQRIGLFEAIVGRLQPILATVPGALATVALSRAEERER
jgi:ERCC4-related helicase